MKNVTLQLFEYLIAAHNSNLSVSYNLNRYPGYWFLEEVLSFKGNKMERLDGDRICITIHQQQMLQPTITISPRLAEILKLMQYDHDGENPTLISKEEFVETLQLEQEALVKKIEQTSKKNILINGWQQLLLGTSAAQLLTSEISQDIKGLPVTIKELAQDYQGWLNDVRARNVAIAHLQKAQALYDAMIKLSHEANRSKKLSLGVGILHIPGEPAIYHPLLCVDVELVIHHDGGICQLYIEDRFLVADALLDHVLFCDSEVVSKMRSDINGQKIDPFDDEKIAVILQQIINHIHPGGHYFTSPVDAVLAPSDAPQALHRSVLFIRESQTCLGEEKLKAIAKYLTAGNPPSDVIGNVVDPGHALAHGNQDKFTFDPVTNQSDALAEKTTGDIMTLLQNNHAVAVSLEQRKGKKEAIVDLIKHLVEKGNRVLIVGEEPIELANIRESLPIYLNGLHHVVPEKSREYEQLKIDLIRLADQMQHHQRDMEEMAVIAEEMVQIQNDLEEVIDQIAEYRALGSKKIYWQDGRYHPYELAQFVSKLGKQEAFHGDLIPLDMHLEIEASEINDIWELRPDFTPEVMGLLNYDFIDLDEIKEYHEYQKMGVLEEKYLQLLAANGLTEQEFDQSIDIRFAQYMFDQLPRLIADVAEIKSPYEMNILKKALASLENHHTLTASLDEINEGIKYLAHFEHETQWSLSEREKLIGFLNEKLEILLIDAAHVMALPHDELLAFYTTKKAEMSGALRVAHLILIFNDGLMSLSPHFEGITLADMDQLETLYQKATVHLSKIEFEICWLRVKSYFTRLYQPTIEKEHLHPTCIALYQALLNSNLTDFRHAIADIEELLRKRQNFIVFGEFIETIGVIMPKFTAAIVSEENVDMLNIPNFKEAFERGKLNYLFDKLQNYGAKSLDKGIEFLKERETRLRQKLFEINCWKNQKIRDASDIEAVTGLLAQQNPSKDEVTHAMLDVFPVAFLNLANSKAIKNYDPTLFDVVIFADAAKSNMIRISELIHAHKAVLFGNLAHKPAVPLKLRREDSKRLMNRYGHTMQHFGEEYFEDSLLNLIINSAAWDAHITLENDGTVDVYEQLAKKVKSGIKRCNSVIGEEIFEALIKMGYDVKCQLETQHGILDFFITGKNAQLAVNIIGDVEMPIEVIKAQINREVALRNTGLNLHIISATGFYLNSRQTLLDLRNHLEALDIYPDKAKKFRD